MIRIKPPGPIDGRAQIADATKFINEDGSEIKGVVRAVVDFSVNNLVTAEITVHPLVEDVWAQEFMSEESFLIAAERYGYRVEKESDDA